ncbi:MAG: methylmalonyl Co-A mutase-associated GTPase MeaB [Thermomicrobiales bacterium]
MVTADEILARLREDPRALPRLATLVENAHPRGEEALAALYPLTGRAHVVGITGPPGAGKSSLIAALIGEVRAGGREVAVVAVDPSSTVSGGAVLGDRIRMMERFADAGVFVRSMASRGRQGGLAWTTANLVHLLDGAGYPLVIIETVGTGQDGTDIASLADTVVVVEAPGLGDGVQAIKSGLLEVGDVVVVNKADTAGADEALRTLRTAFEYGHPRDDRRVPVFGTDAVSGRGVDRLLTELDAHRAWLAETGKLAERRELAARAEILAGVRQALDARLRAGSGDAAALHALVQAVAARELTPQGAVARVVGQLGETPAG